MQHICPSTGHPAVGFMVSVCPIHCPYSLHDPSSVGSMHIPPGIPWQDLALFRSPPDLNTRTDITTNIIIAIAATTIMFMLKSPFLFISYTSN